MRPNSTHLKSEKKAHGIAGIDGFWCVSRRKFKTSRAGESADYVGGFVEPTLHGNKIRPLQTRIFRCSNVVSVAGANRDRCDGLRVTSPATRREATSMAWQVRRYVHALTIIRVLRALARV